MQISVINYITNKADFLQSPANFNTLHKNKMKELFDTEIKIGNNILNYVTEGIDRNKSKSNYDLALSGENVTIIEDYGNDQRIVFESSYSPIYNATHEIIGVTVFARDITAKIKRGKIQEFEK